MTEPLSAASTAGPSGNPAVTQLGVVASALDAVEDLALADAAARFEAVHSGLQAALAELDGP